ncbi:MAG: bifunctional hydroxymethylpyrimidine kinase/phosphomethylpyrimidine kinase [Verrucomicrobiota bacterium]
MRSRRWPPKPRPIAWTIAGSDSGGGAGIQADLKTMNTLGVHGCSLVTSLTAQNSQGIANIEHTSPDFIQEQFDALLTDMPPTAIKIGMLGSPEMVEQVAERLFNIEVFKILDPILFSSSGTRLLDEKAIQAFMSLMLPSASLLTPNIPEAQSLLGLEIETAADVEKAGEQLLMWGAQSVLIKGGHLDNPSFSQDYWTNGIEKAWLTSPRIDTENTHGTGCVLSSAIASATALGYHLLDALVIAKTYLNQALRHGYAPGQGKGVLAHPGWPESADDLPWITDTAEAGRQRPSFARLDEEPLGLYPIVDRFEWVKKLVPLGVKTLQLRVKDLEGDELETEIRQSIDLARDSGCRLFINDAWELALKHDAWGVHLGQDDLEEADLNQLADAGLRLGLSTHSFTEIARAMAYNPSYIALGTLFQTTSKTMDYSPLGLPAFERMRKVVPVPAVAIGGITLERAPDVIAAGADGCAVISDIREADDLPDRVAQWLDRLEKMRRR